MTAKELIEALSKMPPDARVGYVWDGYIRTIVRHVWLSRGGRVALAGYTNVVYDDRDRPANSPLVSMDPYWSSDDDPHKIEGDEWVRDNE